MRILLLNMDNYTNVIIIEKLLKDYPYNIHVKNYYQLIKLPRVNYIQNDITYPSYLILSKLHLNTQLNINKYLNFENLILISKSPINKKFLNDFDIIYFKTENQTNLYKISDQLNLPISYLTITKNNEVNELKINNNYNLNIKKYNELILEEKNNQFCYIDYLLNN